MKKLAYLMETEARQEMEEAMQQLKAFGYDQLYMDSYRNNITRPKQKEVMGRLMKGDTLVIYSLANATRNLTQMIHLLGTTEDREIRLVSTGDNIDTDDPISRQWRLRLGNYLVDQRSGDRAARASFAAANEFRMERYESKKVRDTVIIDMYHSRYRIVEIAERTSLSKQQIFRILKKHGIQCDRNQRPAQQLPPQEGGDTES